MQMGARIEGIGSNLMIVHGQDQLGGADYAIGPDYIEVGSFIALAACTGGELRIRDVVPDDLRMTRLCFERLGCVIEFDGNDVRRAAGPAAAHQVATRATPSPRSRTGRGRRSPPTSRASRSRWPPRPTGWC